MNGYTGKKYGRGFSQSDNYLKNAEISMEGNYNKHLWGFL